MFQRFKAALVRFGSTFNRWLACQPIDMDEHAAQCSIDDFCRVPPIGWYCTRKRGHSGPCAARRTDGNDDAYFEEAAPVDPQAFRRADTHLSAQASRARLVNTSIDSPADHWLLRDRRQGRVGLALVNNDEPVYPKRREADVVSSPLRPTKHI